MSTLKRILTTKADGSTYFADPQHRPYYHYLTTDGTFTGPNNANGDYSTTGQYFYVKPGAGEVLQISQMIVSIEDVGAFDSGYYGNAISLTNGLCFHEKQGAEVATSTTTSCLNGEVKIKTNGQWAAKCHDFTEHGFGSGNVWGTARWSFAEAGQLIRLVGDNDEWLGVYLNDDFTGLVSHRFFMEGFYEDVEE